MPSNLNLKTKYRLYLAQSQKYGALSEDLTHYSILIHQQHELFNLNKVS